MVDNGETLFDEVMCLWELQVEMSVRYKPGVLKRGENCKHAFSHYNYIGGSCNFGVQ